MSTQNKTNKEKEHLLTDEDKKLIREVAKKHGFKNVRFEGENAILVHSDESEKTMPAKDLAVIMGK